MCFRHKEERRRRAFTVSINLDGFLSKAAWQILFLIQVAGLLHEHFSTKTQSTSLSSFVYGEASLIGEKSGLPQRKDKEMSWYRSCPWTQRVSLTFSRSVQTNTQDNELNLLLRGTRSSVIERLWITCESYWSI